jgi:hypothetical protein
MGARLTTLPARAFRLVVALGLAWAPMPAHARAPEGPAVVPAAGEQDPPAGAPAAPAGDLPPATEPAASPDDASQSAGLGTAVATDDPESKRAKAELEGTALAGAPVDGVPERLPPLQRGAWWSVFAGFALASVGGVFAGLAETEEDKAARLVAQVDPTSGGALRYADVKGEYNEILARGRRDAVLAQTFLAVGGAVLVVGISLFVADRVKRRPARVRAGLGGLQVRF